jgi:hypothetical protein
MNGGKAQLFDALVSGQGLQELVETAARVLGQPLALCDPCWIVRYRSKLPAIPENVMQSGRRGQYLVGGFLEAYELACYQDSRWTRLEFADCQNLVRPICAADGIPLAYLIVFGQASRFGHEQLTFIEIFCQIVLSGLPPAGHNLTLLPLPETMLLNLMRGQEPVDYGSIQDYFDKSGHEYFVCVIDEIIGQSLKAVRMLKLVEEVNYQALIVHEGYPVLLVNCECAASLGSQLAHLGLTGGISYPFDHLDNFNLFYRQARRAAAYRVDPQSGSALTAYLDIACLDLAAALGTKHPAASRDLHPVIQAILQHDRAHGTQYFKTVAAFIESGGNLKACAQLLDVRWSTLNNRIGRMGDLFNINLKSHSILSQLYFSSAMAWLWYKIDLAHNN